MSWKLSEVALGYGGPLRPLQANSAPHTCREAGHGQVQSEHLIALPYLILPQAYHVLMASPFYSVETQAQRG